MKKVILTIMAIVCLMFASVSIAMADDTLPPTSISQDELTKLKAMSLDDLRAVAKPMPEEALNKRKSDIGDSNKFPKDGNTYYIHCVSSDGSIDDVYYKFLYVTIGPSKNMVTYHIYKWEWYREKMTVSDVLHCDNYNPELYAQLLKLDNDTNSGNKDGDTRFPNPDENNSNSNNNNSSGNISTVSVQRIKGNTRIETAAAIANKFNSETVQAVIVATGNNFPDALSGSVLAKKLNAPILLAGLTPIDSYPVIDYISKHLSKDGTVYILGGQGAVNESIVLAIRVTGHNNIKRLDGLTRYQTNKAINDEYNAAKGTPIVLATGDDFPDALSISSIAAIKGYPIVLTQKSNLPSESEETIRNLKPTKVYVVGGTSVISDEIKNKVINIAGLTDSDVIRIWGQGRYETSINIAKYFNINSDTICFATGSDFPDALAGSVYAAKLNAPILLVSNDNGELMNYISKTNYINRIIFGGTGAINTKVESELSR